ncbi:MAG: fibronectin type III domain-containing protein [Nitrospinae bacterium]|nr:fibronectin type III domain-containing protein [Nitrospinota bacterium]
MIRYSKVAAVFALLVTLAACSGSGSSSDNNSGTPGSTLPAPTGLAAVVGDGEVTLTWDAAQGANWYNVYWAAGSSLTTASANRTGSVTGASYTVTGLTNGTAYAFAVASVSQDGTESGLSSVIIATPATQIPTAPAGVSLSVDNGFVTLTWTSGAKADSYNVYWSNSSPVTTADNRIANVSALSLSHAGLTTGTIYYYMITSVNGSGESDGSISPSATPKANASGVTPKIAITSANGEIILSWDAVEGVNNYNIYWNNSGAVTTADNRILAGGVTTYTFTGLTPGTRYYYVVTAVFSTGGEGSASSEVSITP